MNFLSVLVMLSVTAVGGLGLLLAGSIGAIVGAVVLGLLLVPSRAVREMGLGGMMGMAAMQQQAAESGPASGTPPR